MNRTIKSVVAALAFMAAVSAFAQEEEEKVESDVVGWTPIAIGIASPVQLPWGLARWDVYGLDLNIFYADAPKMYGLDLAFATVTRDDLIGAQFSGLFNYSLKDVYGLRATLGLNMCSGITYGADFGGIAFRDELCGFSAEFLGCAQREMTGVQLAGLATVTKERTTGAVIAGLTNLCPDAHGLQLSALYNMTECLNGCQIALVNFARECPAGFQIGLVNIILDNKIKVLPIVNGYF